MLLLLMLLLRLHPLHHLLLRHRRVHGKPRHASCHHVIRRELLWTGGGRHRGAVRRGRVGGLVGHWCINRRQQLLSLQPGLCERFLLGRSSWKTWTRQDDCSDTQWRDSLSRGACALVNWPATRSPSGGRDRQPQDTTTDARGKEAQGPGQSRTGGGTRHRKRKPKGTRARRGLGGRAAAGPRGAQHGDETG